MSKPVAAEKPDPRTHAIRHLFTCPKGNAPGPIGRCGCGYDIRAEFATAVPVAAEKPEKCQDCKPGPWEWTARWRCTKCGKKVCGVHARPDRMLPCSGKPHHVVPLYEETDADDADPVAAAEEKPTLQDYDDTGHHVCRAAEVVCVCGRHIRSVAAAEVLEHKITDKRIVAAWFGYDPAYATPEWLDQNDATLKCARIRALFAEKK